MKILTVVGARPQFIKLAPVSKVLSEYAEEIVVHTGQHYDSNMSDIFFKQLNITKPKYNLNIGSGNHGEQTGRMLKEIESLLVKEKPVCLLVYGDTNSTLAGALAASKLHIPVAHVEAGLRSYNKKMPEEVNRILTDHVSQLLFSPTKQGVENLFKEGIVENVFEVGDVMYDSVLQNISKLDDQEILGSNNLKSNDYILLTLHRAENTDNRNRIINIIQGLSRIETKIIWPIHPRTQKCLDEYNINLSNYKNIKLIEPVGYIEMLALLKNSSKVITDSGGVQKEAFFTNTPCITLRDETEWVETVEIGVNKLVGDSSELIAKYASNFTVDFSTKPQLYGDGTASEKIVKSILYYFG